MSGKGLQAGRTDCAKVLRHRMVQEQQVRRFRQSIRIGLQFKAIPLAAGGEAGDRLGAWIVTRVTQKIFARCGMD